MVASSDLTHKLYSVIASEAKQSSGDTKILDCFVASLLAMTGKK
jgi:hypothetical protein